MTRRAATATLILAVGLGAAAAVYATSAPPAENEEVYDLLHSRRYTRELERIGGKAGVLASEATDWVASLWEGRRRAAIVAVATVLVPGAYLALTRPAPRDEEDAGGTGRGPH